MLTLDEMRGMTFPEMSVEFALRQHDAYARFALGRLAPMISTKGIDEQTDQFEYENKELIRRLSNEGVFPNGGSHTITEKANSAFRQELHFIREQLISIMHAGLYHLWERSIINFLRVECKDFEIPETDMEKIAHANFDDIKSWLGQGYLPIDVLSFLDKIELLSIVANAAKHPSEGRAWKKLRETDYAALGLPEPLWDGEIDEPNFTERHFLCFLKCIEAFWQGVHDRLVEIGRARNK